MKSHDRIFLHTPEGGDWVTWSEDKIHDSDVEYIRADLALLHLTNEGETGAMRLGDYRIRFCCPTEYDAGVPHHRDCRLGKSPELSPEANTPKPDGPSGI